jgi:hypoxanthine phosphoribosyltransferase
MIRLHDKTFELYITAASIEERVRSMANQINQDFALEKPLFIAILNGSFMFAADLFKHISIDAEICFIKMASYKGTKSSGQLVTAIGLDTDVYARHVVIIEDIVDTGNTLHEFLPQLQHQQPASLQVAALLHKPEATVYPIQVRYVGFSIPNQFVVGYGLDYNGLGRNRPDIYRLSQ